MSFRSWASTVFGCDLRSLALMRIGYGLLILADLAVRSTALTAHYTDLGALPRELFFQSGQPFSLSLYGLGGTPAFVALLMLAQAGLAVALMVGWRTRVCTLLSWFFLASLQHRNYAILNGGDEWMRLTLLWAIFLPWGERWSVDGERAGNRVFSAATFAFVQQVFSVYFLAGLAKTGSAWWEERSAAQLALLMSEWNGSWSKTLLYHTDLLGLLTSSVLVMELAVPWLLLVSWRQGALRTVAVAAFFLFHLGLGLVMELGMFPWVGMVTVVGLLPKGVWQTRWGQQLEAKLDAFRSAPIPGMTLGPTSSAVLLVLCLYGAAWNLTGLFGDSRVPPRARVPAYLLRLDQYWGLFAPEPARLHGWPVVEGRTSDGQAVELFREEPLSWLPPESSSDYPNQRWKRLFVSASLQSQKRLSRSLLTYLVHRWQRRHPEQELVEARFFWLVQPSSLDFKELPPDRILLATWEGS